MAGSSPNSRAGRGGSPCPGPEGCRFNRHPSCAHQVRLELVVESVAGVIVRAVQDVGAPIFREVTLQPVGDVGEHGQQLIARTLGLGHWISVSTGEFKRWTSADLERLFAYGGGMLRVDEGGLSSPMGPGGSPGPPPGHTRIWWASVTGEASAGRPPARRGQLGPGPAAHRRRCLLVSGRE